jgi:predicted PurR-regulated permease PerM
MPVFLAGLCFFFWLLWALKDALLPFVVGFLLAYLLLPVMQWVERRLKWKRPVLKRVFTIFIVYVVGAGMLYGLVIYGASAVSTALTQLLDNAPVFITRGMDTLKEIFQNFRSFLSLEWQAEVDKALGGMAGPIAETLKGFFFGSLTFVTNTTSALFGFLILPVFLFFVLMDWERLGDGFYAGLPAWSKEHMNAQKDIFRQVVRQYIGSMLLLAVVVFVLIYAGLSIMQVPYSLALASFCALMQFLPIIGPWLAVGVCLVVVLAVVPHMLGQSALLILMVELALNMYLVPRIQSSFMNIHPAILLIVGVIGAYVAGIVGFIIAIPLAVFVRSNVRYWRGWVSVVQAKASLEKGSG